MIASELDSFIEAVASMDRRTLITVLRAMQCDFTLDFSDQCLAEMSTGRLRHVIAAASAHARNIHELTALAAA